MDTPRRPHSFSEGSIRLPRVESSQKPLMLHVGSINSEVWTVGGGLPPEPPVDSPTQTLALAPPPNRNFYLDTAHRWGIRFSLHLSLIAIFETVFFWRIVAQSEDDALTELIGSYTNNIVASLGNMSASDRNATDAILNSLVNIAAVISHGTAAAADRSDYNNALLTRGWTYFGAIAGLCTLLSAAAPLRSLPIRWRHVVLENFVLVTFLALYEWMFFHTIVFKYRAVSIEELDSNIINQISHALN